MCAHLFRFILGRAQFVRQVSFFFALISPVKVYTTKSSSSTASRDVRTGSDTQTGSGGVEYYIRY